MHFGNSYLIQGRGRTAADFFHRQVLTGANETFTVDFGGLDVNRHLLGEGRLGTVTAQQIFRENLLGEWSST